MSRIDKHIIIYDEQEIHYIEADLMEINIDNNSITYENPRNGIIEQYPTNRTFTFTTANGFDEDTIKLDDTLMKRIAKYNKEKELQKIQKEIEEKEKQIKELDDKLQDKEKRWKKVQEYIANIYNLDLEEDDEEDYYDEY